ncbi:hypothetical protein AB0M02_08795 [Actinoplanes sp. NPDC051861]|uniref:hypothetical protein n=1 Tax=Actinoplanes sp. NPDC051861 TaxID=3155170 RepID=UPI003421EAE2
MTDSAQTASWRRRGWLLLYTVLVVAGPVQTITTAVVKFGDEAKKDRLEAAGFWLPAVVVTSDQASSSTYDKTKLTYDLLGRTYTATIRGYLGEPGTATNVLVDPADPSSFMAVNGRTDDSRHPFNTWAGMPWGVVFTALGVTGFVVDRRQRRAVPAAVDRPGRPGKLNKRSKS